MISVIIPTLNEEKLLPSLLAQLTPDLIGAFDLEVLISDGGSTDATKEIVERHGFRFVSKPVEEKQTIAGGRNAGAALARGELLVFINGDIRFKDVHTFFEQVQRFASDTNAAGATCEVQVFPEEERLTDVLFHFIHNMYVRFLNFIGEGMGRGECHIIRRELFEQLGGYNSTMAAGEDYDLFRRVRRTGKIMFLPKVVVYESPRRFRKYGYTHIVWGWTRNALAVVFKNRSSSESWDAVR